MGAYKDTLFLPKTDMPIRADLPANEPAVYKFWDETKVFDRMRRDGQNPYILHDGPPYANGNIHIGHALNKILKDFAVKFQYFNGRAVEFAPGWDCHGLPIEQKVQVKWRLGGPMRKSDNGRGLTPMSMEEAGADFTAMCREYATEQVAIQMEQFKTLGVLADWEHRYETMSPEYEQMISARLQELYDKGYLIRRKKPVYWSWVFNTALAEAEVEYRDKTDESVYLKFRNAADFDVGNATKSGSFLVWTTTPWTLPANVAVAVNPNLKYYATLAGSELVFVAQEAHQNLFEKGIVKHPLCSTLTNAPIIFDFDYFKDMKLKHPIYPWKTVPVVAADFVAADKGTGCVHIAPGHGEDDFQVAMKYNLPIVVPVDGMGHYCEGKYGPQHPDDDGLWIFQDDSNLSLAAKKDGTYKECSYQSNKRILDDLKADGLLVHVEKITHSYPYCSRSGTPIIFRATDQWFLDLDKIRREQPLEVLLKNVDFYPENSKNRLLPMLQGRPDWCISRQRKWGVKILDSEDILDVWFDSGLSWNVLGNRQADLYLEGNDQHRGWFQSSLWLSAVLAGRAPYKEVVTHGFVVDQNGEKMAKSKGNVIAPEEVIKKYGAEVLRYWVASADYTKDLQCSEEILQRAAEGHKKLRNTFRFLVANMPQERVDVREFSPIDTWILQRSGKVFAEVYDLFRQQLYYSGIQKLTEFVNGDLNAVYMNAVKDRLYCSIGENRDSAVTAMSEILMSLLTLISPLFTYTAHEVFTYLPDWLKGNRKDIFDCVYRPIPQEDARYGETVEDFWKEVLSAFHAEFGRLREEGKVRDTLDVLVEGGFFFEGAEDWFVCSGVRSFSKQDALAEFQTMFVGDFEQKPVKFRIIKSEQNKCERCWKRNTSEQLCDRCKFALQSIKNVV